MRQAPLPPSKDGDETVTLLGSPRPDPSVEEQPRAVYPLIAFEMQPENQITVTEGLRVRHTAIA